MSLPAGLSTWLALRKEPPIISEANKDTPILLCHGTSDPEVRKRDLDWPKLATGPSIIEKWTALENSQSYGPSYLGTIVDCVDEDGWHFQQVFCSVL
jgi:hypothetical protein